MTNPDKVDQDKSKDPGKMTPPPDGKEASPFEQVEKQPNMVKNANPCPFRPLAKLNLEGDEKWTITKSVADPSLVGNFIPNGKIAFLDTPASGTIACIDSSTIMSDNPNLIRPTPKSSKAPHDHNKVGTKGSDTKVKKPRSVDVPVLVGGSNEKIAPKKSLNAVEEHKQESGGKGKTKADHEQKKPSSADVIEHKDKKPKKKSADNGKHGSPKRSISKEKGKEEVSPPTHGKTKGSQTKISHSKPVHSSHKSNEKVIKTIVPGDQHHSKSKTKSNDKHKPKSADKKDK